MALVLALGVLAASACESSDDEDRADPESSTTTSATTEPQDDDTRTCVFELELFERYAPLMEEALAYVRSTVVNGQVELGGRDPVLVAEEGLSLADQLFMLDGEVFDELGNDFCDERQLPPNCQVALELTWQYSGQSGVVRTAVETIAQAVPGAGFSPGMSIDGVMGSLAQVEAQMAAARDELTSANSPLIPCRDALAAVPE